MSSAVVTSPGLTRVSCGYKGTSDGWVDLSAHHRMLWHYSSAPDGNVVQTGRTSLTGTGRHQNLRLAVGFGASRRAALAAANGTLATGWPSLTGRYATGWHQYLASLRKPPSSLTTAAERRAYLSSAMVLAASEDKTYRGAYVASPTMPWAWGTGLQQPTGPYHLVWARDLYEIATALKADGDLAGARRALHFLLFRQQEANGSFPQNSADDWQAKINQWTLTTNGPYGGSYYPRLTKDGNPNAGTTYDVGDSGPSSIDQRAVVDPSFLEMVRLGVKAPSDPNILRTISVVDAHLSDSTPTGTFWHRYTGDGHSAAAQLAAMASTANDGGMLPEQVWDQNPPSGSPGFPAGHATFSATPLAWTHAQLIRLAWSIVAGHPVEQPRVVACRYVRKCA